jgi:hypothetical protein
MSSHIVVIQVSFRSAVPADVWFRKEEGIVRSNFKLWKVHIYSHQISVSILTHDMSHEVLKLLGTLDFVQMIHLKSTHTLWAKYHFLCDVSVYAHLVEGCAYNWALNGFALVNR